MKVNKFLPFAVLYFFINSLALPYGLLYTSLLAPFFYCWILVVRKKEILLPFLTLLMPFILVQLLFVGVDTKSYFLSLLNFLLVYIFCQAFYTFLRVCGDPGKIFTFLLRLNFILCLIAIPFYFTAYYQPLWIEQNIATNVGHFRRLQMFTYEPSYYAFIFIPVFFFFLLQYVSGTNQIRPYWLLPMLFLPFVLSFSIGVIAAALLAGIFLWVLYFQSLTSRKRVLNGLIFAGLVSLFTFLVLLVFFRHNPVFTRFANIFSGKDSSGNGRIRDAFILANKLLVQKNEFWGIGLGQVKILGEVTIRNYYLYYSDARVAIPNAVAETLAVFGWLGLGLRFMIEIFLFFRTRVWTNYYRFLLFMFIFIYQFTGSFITNVAEYVIWIIAFSRAFQQFDRKNQSH